LYDGVEVTCIDSDSKHIKEAILIVRDEEMREKISKIEGVDIA
jgi:Bicoid-interacting protein 3 (Bin3)